MSSLLYLAASDKAYVPGPGVSLDWGIVSSKNRFAVDIVVTGFSKGDFEKDSCDIPYFAGPGETLDSGFIISFLMLTKSQKMKGDAVMIQLSTVQLKQSSLSLFFSLSYT